MLEILFYIPTFKSFPELSSLIFLIIKIIGDLPFKEKKLPSLFLSEAVPRIFAELGAPKGYIAPEDQNR